ncbi:membrane protein [Bordetella pertussis]|nr:membrane protein [Bordetella pertussis]
MAREAPPPLPVYQQPPVPGDGYIWVPGYWALNALGFYWVPGVWMLAPYPGALWTPGYWAYDAGYYRWRRGYWGPHIGFYGVGGY